MAFSLFILYLWLNLSLQAKLFQRITDIFEDREEERWGAQWLNFSDKVKSLYFERKLFLKQL
jgi:hypothetical protein